MRRALAIVFGLVLAATGLLLFAWLLWWLWKREQEAMQQIEIEVRVPPLGQVLDAEGGEAPLERAHPQVRAQPRGQAEDLAPAAKGERLPATQADDLKRIEGIGPKIASVLEGAGITTFSGLAEVDVTRIREILEQEDPRLGRLADPTTWPEQAALAGSGDWQALASLQNELKGGRRG
ncbi:MAG: hypothetical protein M8467_04960 [Anaerolineae bacterium]|nr:hypothetical protein [Anaerolineae bacterium]